MFNQLLPQTIDKTYRGHELALWLFAVLVSMKSAMSLNAIFNGFKVASVADGIPLDTYPSAAAQTIVALLASWGLGHFTICLLCLLVLVRYRSLIPFMFSLLLVEHLTRKQLILHFIPVVRTGAPLGSEFNLALLALTIVGLALSLWKRGDPQAQE